MTVSLRAMSTATILADARRRLGPDPAAAAVLARQAGEGTAARFVLGAALRRTGDLAEAEAALVPLLATQTGAWGVHYELGMALAGRGSTAAAVARLAAAVARNPASTLAAHALAGQRALLGEASAPLPGDPAITAAAHARLAGDLAPLAALGLHVSDIGVAVLVADASSGAAPAVALLTAALATTPAYLPARVALAAAHLRADDPAAARAELAAVTAAAPAARVHGLRAAVHMAGGDVAAALADYAVATEGDDAAAWHGYGHALRAAGRAGEAVAAYRRTLTIAPGFAEAWWSLANLKTGVLGLADVAAMTAALPTAADADAAYLHFALGAATADPASSFAHYAAGNAARRAAEPFDRAAHDKFVARTIATFTPELVAARAGGGDPDPAPIFVVGLPRSGSTLVEQVLASHPQIDGLSELADLPRIARTVPGRYPDTLATLPAAAFADLGAAYLARVAPRRSGRAFFVDKFPGNYLHAGLIALALPNAKIIDVRRDARGTGVSLFTQLFARGQAYAYDLGDLGFVYHRYVGLIDHFARVLPGRILTLSYEALVDDTEGEVRRLLAHVGIAFDPACLRFFASDRVVRTPSSEQVRRPITRAGLDGWRRFEPWLDPLLVALRQQ